MRERNNKKHWTESDWDNSNPIRRLHKEITGMTLDDSLLGFYGLIAFVAFIAVVFGN